MKSISVGELRQNPTAALDAVEHGATIVVTRHRREVGRLIPPERRTPVTGAAFAALVLRTPVDEEWANELAEARRDWDEARDTWTA